MLIIDCTDQVTISAALPLKRSAVFSASAAPVAVVGAPDAATALTVIFTNPDGIEISNAATRVDDKWCAMFAPSCFPTYGYVSNGVRLVATIPDMQGNQHDAVLATGDLEVMASTPATQPADPSLYYQTKGGDIYVKSEVVNGTQHYKLLSIVYDSRLRGWGFNDPQGDYILSNGSFIPV